jgi:hypothetical protein
MTANGIMKALIETYDDMGYEIEVITGGSKDDTKTQN